MPKIRLLSVIALSLLIALSVTVPVLAESGSGSSGSGSSGSSSDDDSTEAGDHQRRGRDNAISRLSSSDDEAETETEHVDSTELRHRGSELLSELRQGHKTKSLEELKEKCQSRKQGLEKKFERITANSERLQKRIDDILAKAQEYQQTNNIQVADLDTLVSAADTAKTNSSDSIAALKEVTPSIDCNNVSVAQDVATFKAAAKQVRDNLKDYRQSVRKLLKALITADKPADSSDTEGSDD